MITHTILEKRKKIEIFNPFVFLYWRNIDNVFLHYLKFTEVSGSKILYFNFDDPDP